jgi:hypothetical protein
LNNDDYSSKKLPLLLLTTKLQILKAKNKNKKTKNLFQMHFQNTGHVQSFSISAVFDLVTTA